MTTLLVAQVFLSFVPDSLARILSLPVQILVILLGYQMFVRFFEQRNVTELKKKNSFPEVFQGGLIGVLLFCFTMIILWGFRSLEIIGLNAWSAVLPWLSLALAASFIEEILIRGVVFRLSEEALGTWPALGLSALLFGVLHLFNPHASLLSSLAIGLEAGILLGAAYILTRHLWLAIGLHFAWNFTESGIFGLALSGNESQGWLQTQLTGPDWLTGGSFGPEASIVAVIVCLVASYFLLEKAKQQGQIKAVRWKTPGGL